MWKPSRFRAIVGTVAGLIGVAWLGPATWTCLIGLVPLVAAGHRHAACGDGGEEAPFSK
jgi:hypothetical protein